jgi:glycosyltransferase involved in cell wall biosynthesis
MKILIVANHNKGSYATFVVEQVESLKKHGVEIDFFGVRGKGLFGYISNLSALKKKIDLFQPDLIHAHYGLCGLLANLQRKIPVVTTYHGSDIHSKGMPLFFSRLSIMLSVYNIFVSKYLQIQSGWRGNKQCIIPCGVDLDIFKPMDRTEARKLMKWDVQGKYVLFSGTFDNAVKNSPLAIEAVEQMEDVNLVELKGYDRKQVCTALNASNCLLLTSFREGSPQVIKEALACGVPIVSVNVGDVKESMDGINGCYITTYDVFDVITSLRQAIEFNGKNDGRERIISLGLDNETVAKRIFKIYKQIRKDADK